MGFRIVCTEDLAHDKFSVTAHVTQIWRVDREANFQEVLEDCDQVLAQPNENDYLYHCLGCDRDAKVMVGDGRDVTAVTVELLHTWPFEQIEVGEGVNVVSFLDNLCMEIEDAIKGWYPAAVVSVTASTSSVISVEGKNQTQEVKLVQRIMDQCLAQQGEEDNGN